MTEPKDLLFVNERLRRLNRRWKALALAACAVLVLMVVGSFVVAAQQQMRLEHERRAVNAALAEAHQARAEVQRAANPGQPR